MKGLYAYSPFIYIDFSILILTILMRYGMIGIVDSRDKKYNIERWLLEMKRLDRFRVACRKIILKMIVQLG